MTDRAIAMGLGDLFGRGDTGSARSPHGQDARPLHSRDRKEAAERLALLQSFEDAGLAWFWATDAQARLTYLSDDAAARLGTAGSPSLGMPLSELFASEQDEDSEKARRPLGFLLGSRNTFSDLPVRVTAPGREVWWAISGKPVFDGDSRFIGYRGSAKDITDVRERSRDASRLAQFDPLTGLANRPRMARRLTGFLASFRTAKRSCALMMLDLDRFKHVNDTLGHQAGDELLKQVARRLERIVGNQGEIGRLGGDEFQVIVPDADDRGQLGELAQRIIQMLSQPYSLDGSRAIIGTSVGIAIAPYDGIEHEQLVGAADLALYAAKGGGRGQYRFYSAELKDGARLRSRIEEDLRDAIQTGEIELHYQPLVRAADNMVSGFEALVRWNHPERGWISPGLFIPIAEETGIVGELGEWALERACADAAQWPGELTVAVNISALQFAAGQLPAKVALALEHSGLDPKRLEIELTESVFLADPRANQDTFAALKRVGVRLALDDFGTGYSSLGYLRTAPFDKLKIDQSFVRGSTEPDSNNSAIITAFVSLARALGMDTVTEGVETLDELALVRELGVSHVQGFVFARALPQGEVLTRLSEGRLEYEPMGPARHRAERRTLFRRVGVIHEDHRYQAVLRNLSKTGARIEGILDVPIGTELVLDLGGGQLAVAIVRRAEEHSQGLEFETPLISDGADGLCTRHRISPYDLATAGMQLAALPPGHYQAIDSGDGARSRPRFMQVDLSAHGSRAA